MIYKILFTIVVIFIFLLVVHRVYSLNTLVVTEIKPLETIPVLQNMESQNYKLEIYEMERR